MVKKEAKEKKEIVKEKGKIVIKPARGKGLGAFANRDFKKGEIIIHSDYTKNKRIVTKKDIPTLTPDEQNHLDYIGDEKFVVDYSPISLVNHSCDPNAFVRYKTMKIKDVVAIKNIKKGEEISYDYATDAAFEWVMKCRCRKANCRKVIYGNYLKLPKKWQEKLWKYVPAWKKRTFVEVKDSK